MIALRNGRYFAATDLENWQLMDDEYRRRAVAFALDLPVEMVDIVSDSDEEVDLASVWVTVSDEWDVVGEVTSDRGDIVVDVSFAEEAGQ